MADRLTAMELFVRVTESGSFSAAARDSATSQSRVSKIIAGLEARLKAPLLVRTTRHMSLTETGERYYRQCKAVLAAIEDAESAVASGQQAITGRLRVNTSAMLALPLVLPALLAFRAKNPGLEVDLVMDDRRIDPVAEAVDLIVRVGALDDSRLVVRRVGRSTFGFYAAPAYLAQTAEPIARLADLARHAVIALPERRQARTIDTGDGAEPPAPCRGLARSP